MNKFIIIEGPDNTGKDTQIKQIIKNFSNECFHMFHYFNLPFKEDKKVHKLSCKSDRMIKSIQLRCMMKCLTL